MAKINTKIYTHNNKESNWDLQEELGLSNEAMDKFRYCAMEVEFEAEVDTETGEAWATAVNGVALAKPVQLT